MVEKNNSINVLDITNYVFCTSVKLTRAINNTSVITNNSL